LVIINGKVLSEGDPVAGGAYVKKIYKDSVVVESQGKEFIIRK
jgi:type II secretory pathway component PulC